MHVASARRRIKFDYDWLFARGDHEGAEAGEFDDSAWRALDVPHDWAIEAEPRADLNRSNGFFPGGVCWYRKRFDIPAMPDGGRASVEFDGVYHNSDVWLNGVHLGARPYGYVTFRYDLTPHLREGGNVIAVRVDTTVCPTSRWYSGSGIYRHVWLDVTDALHVAQWGTYVTTPRIEAGSADVRIRTTVRNEGERPEECTLVTTIIDPSGAEVATAEAIFRIAPDEEFDFDQTLEVPTPELWSLEAPKLYSVRSTVKTGDAVRDGYTTSFGIREAKFDPQRGFLLNGEPVKMKGVCNHHDAGCLGAAVPERALERRLEALRELGTNAIRTSHNPPAPEFLDLTDRMGFLVIDECFDKWRGGYYEQHFDEWWERDVDAMVRRDRNHPSVVLWSVGNEVREQDSAEGAAVASMLVEYVHEHEPTRPVTVALCPVDGASRSINDNGFAAALDVVAYNYQEAWYASDKALYPERIVLGTECYPHFSRRSTEHVDFTTRNPWYDVAENDWVAGQFLWSGIDYLGEALEWPSKGWPNGIVDTCGWPKARSHFHRSVWRDDPFVGLAVLDDALDIDHGRAAWSWPRLAAHWNFAHYTGRVIRVRACTNCETVELMLNGRSMGVRCAADFENSTVVWHVPWEPGEVRAIGRTAGVEAASDVLRSAGAPVRIELRPDRTEIAADGQDVCHIEARLFDSEGVLVPDDERLVKFAAEGAGRIAGVDNGDLRSADLYCGTGFTTRWGRCLCVVKAARSAGAIALTASVEGLPDARVELRAVEL